MKADNKQYKFINSQTGNAIYYHTLNAKIAGNDIKTELEKIRAQVATQNKLLMNLIYWEETGDRK